MKPLPLPAAAARLVAACAAAAVLVAQPAAATPASQGDLAADLQRFVARALDRLEVVPGVAVAVVHGDEVAYLGGHGVADVTTGAPVGPDTAFYIASSTKPFTALAIAALDARGEVELEAPVADWAPDSPLPAGIAARVSLADLLSHRSGLDNPALSFRSAMSGEHAPQVMTRLLGATVERDDTPYGTFRYSNAGYNLATGLLERRTGRDWRTLVETGVLGPAGMAATTSWASRAAALAPGGAAVGHLSSEPGPPAPTPLPKVDATMQSAGGLMSTARDMARWLELQLNDGVIDGVRVLPEGLVASTHAPRVEVDDDYTGGYGLGWQTGLYGGEVLRHHFGGFSGWRTHMSFMPERRVGVVVLVNEDAIGGALGDLIANYAYDHAAGRPDLETHYSARLDDLVALRDRRHAAVAADRASRGGREWTLTRPMADYAGVYENRDFGRVRVSAADGRLEVTLGVMRAVAEPFTRPDSLRVELVPGRGEAVLFELDEAGRPAALAYQGERFVRR